MHTLSITGSRCFKILFKTEVRAVVSSTNQSLTQEAAKLSVWTLNQVLLLLLKIKGFLDMKRLVSSMTRINPPDPLQLCSTKPFIHLAIFRPTYFKQAVLSAYGHRSYLHIVNEELRTKIPIGLAKVKVLDCDR